MKPEQLRYAETHEWVHVADEAGRKVGTVGITAFAIEQLTDLVHMVLPKVGAAVQQGKEFGEVESVKAVSSLYSPVDGEVIAVNTALPGKLETLGSDPYGEGWMIKVALAGDGGAGKLMDLAAYQKQCAAEG